MTSNQILQDYGMSNPWEEKIASDAAILKASDVKLLDKTDNGVVQTVAFISLMVAFMSILLTILPSVLAKVVA